MIMDAIMANTMGGGSGLPVVAIAGMGELSDADNEKMNQIKTHDAFICQFELEQYHFSALMLNGYVVESGEKVYMYNGVAPFMGAMMVFIIVENQPGKWGAQYTTINPQQTAASAASVEDEPEAAASEE